jgi:hypothetical protein
MEGAGGLTTQQWTLLSMQGLQNKEVQLRLYR